MASPKDSDVVGGIPAPRFKLSDLPSGVTASDIENSLYAQTVDEDITDVEVTVLGGGKAIVVVHGMKDVEAFIKKKHRLGRHWFQVEIDQPCSPSSPSQPLSQSILPDMIQVTGDLPAIELLEMYFEGIKSGGGEDKEVEWIKKVQEGVVHVKFSTKEDAALVVDHECHSVCGKVLQVCYAPDLSTAEETQVNGLSPVATTDSWVLLISCIPKYANRELLVHFIENRLGLEHEKEFTLKFQAPHAQLVFSSERDLEEMAKKLTSKKLKGQKLMVEPYKPTLMEKSTAVLVPKRLIISNIPSEVEAEMLELLIDGVLGLQNQKDYTLVLKLPKAQMMLSSTHSEQELEAMCQKLMSKSLKGQKLTVELVHEVPVAIDPGKLLICDIPQNVDEEYLTLFIENRLQMKAEDFNLTFNPPRALLTFMYNHSEKELEQKRLTLMGKPLKGQSLTVELCEENKSIIVRSLGKNFCNCDMLEMYFGQAALSGGGDVEAITMMGSDTALITFKDPKVVPSVLNHTHSRLGPDANVEPQSPLDTFSSQSHEQQQSDEEEYFQDASTEPLVPTEPLKVSVDPLIAKYLTKQSSLLSVPLESVFISIQIDESNGVVTVTPSSSSPVEWPEKSKEIVHEVLSTTIVKEVISIPPEAAAELYPPIMKSCKEGGLQYDLNDANTQISVAGDSGHVVDLKRQIDDLCTHFIKKNDSIPLSLEDFTFLSALKSADIARQYPNVELQCHNDCSVSLHGPIKYVEELKENLPQILAHSKATVTLCPLAIRFLQGEHGRQQLERIIQGSPVVPFFCSTQQEGVGNRKVSLYFLSSVDNGDSAQALAISVSNDIKMEARPLPQSFHAKVSTSPDFEEYKKRMHKQFPFLMNVENDQLLVVSTVEKLQPVIQCLVHYIAEACSVSKTIPLKRGVWRLFNSSASDKWAHVTAIMKEKGVQLVQSTKTSAWKPSITIKGEPEAVEDLEGQMLHLQSSVRTKDVPVSRPGICHYFFKDPSGKMVISGIEHKAKVCIEVGVEEDQPTEDVSASATQQKFSKICWATTSEMKTISVYVGDITEFNKAEVIVNAANEELKHIGGVALGIAKKGGPIIQQDSDDHTRRKGKVDTGSVVLIQRVGDLPRPYKAIVHAVGPRWGYGQSNERQIALLKKAVRNALCKAKDYSSIALPAISTGVYGFPVAVSAAAIIEAAVDFSKKEPQTALNEINIVAFSRKDAEDFHKAIGKNLENVFSEAKSSPTSKTPDKPGTTTDTYTRKKRKSRSTGSTATSAPTAAPKLTFSSSPATRQAAIDCIKISNGSILDVNAEALVNTTDQNLGFGGYVSQALLKAAGDSLKDECDKKKKPVAMGGVTVTGAGNLKSKHIIHTVLPSYDGPSGTAEKTLRNVVMQCLQQCTQLGLKSVAIPSIGAGNLKYPDPVVAQCLLDETLRYLEVNHGKTSLQLVHFVVFMPRTFQAFEVRHRALVSGDAEEEDEDSVVNFLPSRSLTPSRVSGGLRDQHEASRLFQEGVCSFSLSNGLVLEVVLGDISDDSSDVIVNPTTANLVMLPSGVQGAILQKGGQALQDACNAISKGYNCLTEGNVITTLSYGSLHCKYVYHIHYSSNDRKKLVKTVLVCLEKANADKHRSIAFPAIGTGMNKYSPSEAAGGMVKALKKFTDKKKAKHLKVVRVVLFQAEVHQQFVEAFRSMEEGSEEGFMQSFVRGVKAVGSLFFPNESQDEDDREPMAGTSVDEEWVSIPPNANFSIDTTVVLTIYGMTEQSVEMAEKNLRSIIDTHIVSDPIVDPRISQLSMQTVEYLEKVAREHKVDIDIDQEEALHTIKLRGCQNDVLAVKDKVRDALAAVSKEETKADAADAIFATVRWTRLLSGEDMDDYDPLTNYEIEQAYRKKQGRYEHETDAEKFVVDFSTFQETDFRASEVVTVKRRDLIKEYSSETKPEEWDPMPTDSSGNELLVHLVTLQPGSKEYQMVETKFKATLSGNTLFTIERLQNPVLYGQYITLKKQMDKRNPPGHQNERWLFHGTSPDTCSKINTQGFNRSFMGKNGTAYGKGVYFARDASYSHGYAAPDGQGKRRMYFTRVLSGQYTIGNSGMIIPPPKNPQLDPNLPFDSTVNNLSNPSIVVVYNDSQNYPAYLITYS